MGIKGIYGEIGPGERVALAKLAIEKFEQTGRPLRVAIDVSIWEFQIQSGKGGTNPAVRTLYYRLLRLRSLSIQPLFVFDGPNKPPFKRNKRTGSSSSRLPSSMTKQVIKLFGFPIHNAPGEAEAECALLQLEGIVDAVLSEDVDTLMFGCGITFKNWSSEDSRGKSPTHVSVYNAKTTKGGKSGLDRQGMVLVALMSGGDYITEGIPGCGIKLACEAARAGFGESLCSISRMDASAVQRWREDLTEQIHNNTNKHFRTKHKSLKIPESFPDPEVLGYYTNPVVSSVTKITQLKREITWDEEINVPELRQFVAEAFDWTYKTGAIKFIRGLAPAILISRLRARGTRPESRSDDVIYTAMNEVDLVRSICGQRVHFSTGGIPELQLIYHPIGIVGMDLESEPEWTNDFCRFGLPSNRDDENGAGRGSVESSDEASSRAKSASPRKRKPSAYDPNELGKIWVPKSIAQVGIPLKVENWEESQLKFTQAKKANPAAKKATARGGMPKGALDRYISISRPGVDHPEMKYALIPDSVLSTQPNLSSISILPTSKKQVEPQVANTCLNSSAYSQVPKKQGDFQVAGCVSVASTPSRRRDNHGKRQQKRDEKLTNPWTVAQSSSSMFRTIQISKPGIGRQRITAPMKSSENINNIDNYLESTSNRTRYPKISPPTLGEHVLFPSPTIPDLLDRNFDLSSSSLAPISSPSPQTKRASTSNEDAHKLKLQNLQLDLSQSFLRVSDQAALELSQKSNLPSLKKLVSRGPVLKPMQSSTRDMKRNSNARDVISLLSSPATISTLPDNLVKPSSSEPLDPGAETTLTRAKKKRLLIERESLLGAWKEVDEDDPDRQKERGRGRVWRESQVEILDMTESP